MEAASTSAQTVSDQWVLLHDPLIVGWSVVQSRHNTKKCTDFDLQQNPAQQLLHYNILYVCVCACVQGVSRL